MIGASAALCVAGVPFDGPMGAARVGFIDGNYVLNPSYEELENSYLDMVVAGTEKAVLMVESEAKELNEDLMLGAVLFGHQEMQAVITVIQQLADEAGKPKFEYEPKVIDKDLFIRVEEACGEAVAESYKIEDKQELSVDFIYEDFFIIKDYWRRRFSKKI